MTEQDRIVTKAMKELIWVLQLTNEQHNYLRTFLNCIYDIGVINGRARISDRKPVQLIYNGVVMDTFDSETIAANRTGYSRTTICRLLKTKSKSVKGYSFRYI